MEIIQITISFDSILSVFSAISNKIETYLGLF